MSLPFFYIEQMPDDTNSIVLSENTSKHIIQVLRMKEGEQLQLTDGKGHVYTTAIVNAHKKKCEVSIVASHFHPPGERKINIAISLLKNASRFEWFLEKATELGITSITPLICHRTEKQHFKIERCNNILVSAMLQSQQRWLPELHEPKHFTEFVQQCDDPQKLIAHCIDSNNKQHISTFQHLNNSTILIGPEGDFTTEEIEQALSADFVPVSLGSHRLRTETAGMVAAVWLNQTA